MTRSEISWAITAASALLTIVLLAAVHVEEVGAKQHPAPRLVAAARRLPGDVAPVSLQVPIDDTVFLYGHLYKSTGTATLTLADGGDTTGGTTGTTGTTTATTTGTTTATTATTATTGTTTGTTGGTGDVPAITGIRNVATGQIVTSATAGTPLKLEGVGLGTDGRLQLGGRLVATPTAWTPTGVTFLAPNPGAVSFTGGWDLYWLAGGGFTLKASTGAFTLLPSLPAAPKGASRD